MKAIRIDVKRAAAFGAMVLFVVASSCGGKAPRMFCNSDNCAGCCDDTGTCKDGSASTNCGSSGITCQQCDSSQSCIGVGDTGYQCRALGVAGNGGGSAMGGGNAGGGGGNSGGGGGTLEGGCDATNCATGCCTAQGACVAYAQQRYSSCGTAGATCAGCPVGKSCQMGVCSVPACDACMDAAGNCRTDKNTQSDDRYCGGANGICAVCDTTNGEHCISGHCSSTSVSCNSSNCDGCCAANTCVGRSDGGIGDAQCGIGAALCATCTNATCNTMTGACDPQMGTGGGGTGTTGSCNHDECTAGGALLPSCDSCSAGVCAVDSFCCDIEWDSVCVDEANMGCGLSCSGSGGGAGGGGAGGGGGGGGGAGGGGTGGAGSCSHDDCTTGGALLPSCDACAGQICGSDSFCCTDTWDSTCVGEVASICSLSCSGSGGGGAGGGTGAGGGGAANCTCTHDECVSGSKLNASCDTCASSICAVDSFCCTDTWDSACVDEVAQVCGLSCSGGGICGGGGTGGGGGGGGGGAGGCAHSDCTTGSKLGYTCDPCVTQICDADTFCCDTLWDSSCVDEVNTICGNSCP